MLLMMMMMKSLGVAPPEVFSRQKHMHAQSTPYSPCKNKTGQGGFLEDMGKGRRKQVVSMSPYSSVCPKKTPPPSNSHSGDRDREFGCHEDGARKIWFVLSLAALTMVSSRNHRLNSIPPEDRQF